MNKKTIATILFALVAMTGQAQTISQDWFKTDTITIKGRIEGYDAEKFGFTTMQCYYEDVFEKEQATLVLDISPDGTFEKSFVISYPSMNRFYTGNSKVDFNEIPFFVRPGETIEIFVRLNEQGKYECIYNNGSSREVERWLKSRKMMSGQCRALSSFEGRFCDVQTVADSVWQNLMRCVSSVSQQFHYTPFEVQLAQAEAQVQFLSAMMTCADNHDMHSHKEEERDIIGNVLRAGCFDSPRDMCGKAKTETGNHNTQETCDIVGVRETEDQCLSNDCDNRDFDP